MSAFESSLYAKEVSAKITLPVHTDSPVYLPNFEYIEEMFNKHEVEYEILDNEETIEIE